ncbi:MAG: glycosyltransferase family 2 protein [Candidatus Omnitrophota bacterium]
MAFNYSRHELSPRDHCLERFFEILPGTLSWGIIMGMTILSVVQPLWAAGAMVAFVLYWVLRLVYMNLFLGISYSRLSIEKETDWMSLIHGLHDPDQLLKRIDLQYKASRTPGQKISQIIRHNQIDLLRKSADSPPHPSTIYHLIILPVAKESRHIMEPSILSLADGIYPTQQVIFVVALESRASAEIKNDVYDLQSRYTAKFMDFLVFEHPADIMGESRVKGANATWAAKHAEKWLINKNIPFEHVIVSCFDADTVAHRDYLACLTYYFMITPSRTRASYQPIPVYYNNLWDVPGFARIIDIGASFFQLVECTNPEKLVTFSSHSMSFKALVEVGFWPVDMISDDSAIFWKSFIHYDGHYQVVPIYTTVSMDIAGGDTSLETFINIYKQKRRWAWGVENLPIVMRAFLQSPRISFYKKIMFSIRLFDMFISWATLSFLLVIINWFPLFFAGREFGTTTMYYMAPRIKGIIFNLSLAGLVVCMFISLKLLSTSTARLRFRQKIVHIFDWFAIPIVILALSSIPAIDAQTRLMFGKYMEFKVTEKYRNRKG